MVEWKNTKYFFAALAAIFAVIVLATVGLLMPERVKEPPEERVSVSWESGRMPAFPVTYVPDTRNPFD